MVILSIKEDGMSKKAFIAVIFFIISFAFHPAHGAERMGVAIIILDANGVSETVTATTTDIFRRELFNTRRFTVIERSKMEEILREQAFQQTGATETQQAADIGRILGVEKVIAGSLSRLGNKFIIDIRFIDVEKGEIELAESVDSDAREEALPAAIRAMALSIASKIPFVGRVVQVEERIVYIDLGSQEGMKVGTLLDVYQVTKTVTDEKGKVILQKRDRIGSVRLSFVDVAASEAEVVKTDRDIKQGDTVRIAGVIPTGEVVVSVSPASAAAMLGGDAVTPGTPFRVPAGKYTLKASAPGYQDKIQEVVVEEGKRTEVRVNLERIVVAQADLSVESVDLGRDIQVGKAVGVEVVIRNRGEAEASNVDVYYYDDNNLIREGIVPRIRSGGSWREDFEIVFDREGTHTLEVVVDPEGVVSESNERNNSYRVRAFVRAADRREPVTEVPVPAPKPTPTPAPKEEEPPGFGIKGRFIYSGNVGAGGNLRASMGRHSLFQVSVGQYWGRQSLGDDLYVDNILNVDGHFVANFTPLGTPAVPYIGFGGGWFRVNGNSNGVNKRDDLWELGFIGGLDFFIIRNLSIGAEYRISIFPKFESGRIPNVATFPRFSDVSLGIGLHL